MARCTFSPTLSGIASPVLISLMDSSRGALCENLIVSIWQDIAKRPYITVGFIAFVSMIPLALTSTAGWIRRLGGRNWQRLHRLVYLTGIAGVTHYWWKVKADTLHPALYALIVALLTGVPSGAVAEAIALAPSARSGTRLDVHSRSYLEPSSRSRRESPRSHGRHAPSRGRAAGFGIAIRRSGPAAMKISGWAGSCCQCRIPRRWRE